MGSFYTIWNMTVKKAKCITTNSFKYKVITTSILLTDTIFVACIISGQNKTQVYCF